VGAIGFFLWPGAGKRQVTRRDVDKLERQDDGQFQRMSRNGRRYSRGLMLRTPWLMKTRSLDSRWSRRFRGPKPGVFPPGGPGAGGRDEDKHARDDAQGKGGWTAIRKLDRDLAKLENAKEKKAEELALRERRGARMRWPT